MIQRIQSLYLFLAGLSALMVLALPIYRIDLTGSELVVGALRSDLVSGGAVVDRVGNAYVAVLSILGGALAIGAIFLYQRRHLQVRIARLAGLCIAALTTAMLFLAVDSAKHMESVRALVGAEEPQGQYGLGAWLPLVGIALCFMAARAIVRDEAKVRSASRLR
ncbi:MAG: DUF4293 domain-containing protein [Bacteroidetes bacterium]|nr:DUF4293 domain-containing protein [Bacteroidota bacterium]